MCSYLCKIEEDYIKGNCKLSQLKYVSLSVVILLCSYGLPSLGGISCDSGYFGNITDEQTDATPTSTLHEPVKIYLKSGVFDPLATLSVIPSTLKLKSTVGYHLVQCTGPIQHE